MKKFGKVLVVIGYILLAVLLTGFSFKAMHWPGANILTILTLSIFAYWYLAVGAAKAFQDKPFNGINIVKSFVGGLSGTIISSGLLYKLMHWPGANVMLVTGLIIFSAFLILFFIKRAKDKKEFDKLDKLVLMIGSIMLATFIYMYLNN